MSAGHTPGPWVGFYDQGKPYAILPAMREGDVCKFAEPFPTQDDARLMVAAPQILRALKYLVAAIDFEGPDGRVRFSPGTPHEADALRIARASLALTRPTILEDIEEDFGRLAGPQS